MSAMIMHARVKDGIREVVLGRDIYDEQWRVIGHECFDWMPESIVAPDGHQINESWWDANIETGKIKPAHKCLTHKYENLNKQSRVVDCHFNFAA